MGGRSLGATVAAPCGPSPTARPRKEEGSCTGRLPCGSSSATLAGHRAEQGEGSRTGGSRVALGLTAPYRPRAKGREKWVAGWGKADRAALASLGHGGPGRVGEPPCTAPAWFVAGLKLLDEGGRPPANAKATFDGGTAGRGGPATSPPLRPQCRAGVEERRKEREKGGRGGGAALVSRLGGGRWWPWAASRSVLAFVNPGTKKKQEEKKKAKKKRKEKGRKERKERKGKERKKKEKDREE